MRHNKMKNKEKSEHDSLLEILKNHFRKDENEEDREEEEEGMERESPMSSRHKMNKNDRKSMAIMIMKKKMKE